MDGRSVFSRLGATAALIALVNGCQSGPGEPFVETDLDLSAKMVWKADAKYVDTPEGKTCSGIEIEELKLESIDIPLASNKVSSDCLIATKDYGQIQYTEGGIAQRPFRVTASQVERLRQLLRSNK